MKTKLFLVKTKKGLRIFHKQQIHKAMLVSALTGQPVEVLK